MFELFDPGDDFVITQGTNLPHWYQPGVTYFITFRTDDSIPVAVADRWYAERDDWLRRHHVNPAASNYREVFGVLPQRLRREYHDRFSAEYLANLDQGYGACVFRNPTFSKIVADSLRHFDGDRYHIGDFVVMPNHVHVIVGLLGSTEIKAVTYSWKKFTATKINQALNRRGRFWHEESFDHLIRSPDQFEAIRAYAFNNSRSLLAGEYHYFRREDLK